MTDVSPYDELGGEPALFAILDDLYVQLFADPMVGFLFAGKDRARIVAEQMVFTRRLLGDRSAVYTGKPVPEAHAALPILPGHFDRRHRLLAETLDRHGAPERPRRVWLAIDAALRPVILRAGQLRIDELLAIAEREARS